MNAKQAILLLSGAVLARSSAAAAEPPAENPIQVAVTKNSDTLTPYQVFELTFRHEGRYRDPTWDVSIDVRFKSPGGKEYAVGGFFYGSTKPQKPVVREWKDERGRLRKRATWPCDPPDLWKARLGPVDRGEWSYRYVFRAPGGKKATGEGTFRVVEGRTRRRGWVRINPKNPFRFVFEDGSPFYPVGFQDGVFDNNHNGSAMDAFSMEGPFRLDSAALRPKPPPGALFARGPSMNPQNGDVYFGRHARAGFNLWRFSPHNFSLPVFEISYDEKSTSPGIVHWEQAVMVDEMLRMTRKHSIRNFYGIFGFARVFNRQPENQRAMEKIKRLIKYSVDRWGAYVDFWEFLNEQKVSDRWYEITIPFLKSIDPYHKPVATSWERPDLAGIDINAPHWYGNENELQSDRVTVDRAQRQKKFKKPVVYGEQGNHRGREDRSIQGIGGVWDPGSARRMRVRCWTAFFNEISFIFWETSYAKDGHYMNLWIGPEERQYIKALQSFAGRLDSGIHMAEPSLSGPRAAGVRAYGLRSDKNVATYLHQTQCAECRKKGERTRHDWSHDRGAVRGLVLAVEVPRAVRGYWYNPRDASIIQSFDVLPGARKIEVPPFVVDIALLITPDGPPDIDGDGVPNDVDGDDDNDGVPDERDAFPLEREEWLDVDGDRIGDNLDADVDADGVADDRNRNGVADNEEKDWDGDGVKSADAVPWDAFPRDPKEWRDSDGDGTGDNKDEDDDGDGWSDAEEEKAGTDPREETSFPKTL